MHRFFAVLLVLVCHACFSGAKTLVVAISDFPPSIDLSDENYGIHGAIVLGALKKSGHPFELKIFSWSRIKQMLDDGEVCSFGWVKNTERLKRWHFSRPYHADVSYLWGRRDNPIQLLELKDALKYRIGVTRGFSYGQKLDALLSTVETDEGFDDTVNLRKLLAGRIDLFPGQALIVEPILTNRFSDQANELEPKITINTLSHHFVCNINDEHGKEVIKAINPLLPNLQIND
ncbi:MAG: hypothetical protein Alis3KO_15200 [Aliiglaciecola sp.]